MANEPIRITRDDLYERVWTTPVSRLAVEFGISGVALGKICTRLDIPRPPRGYWAQVAQGQKPAKERLPRAKADTRTEFVIEGRQNDSPRAPQAPLEEAPRVTVADTLRSAHPAVKLLVTELDRRGVNRDNLYYLRGQSEACVRLDPSSKRRALLLLDARVRGVVCRTAGTTTTDAHEPLLSRRACSSAQHGRRRKPNRRR